MREVKFIDIPLYTAFVHDGKCFERVGENGYYNALELTPYRNGSSLWIKERIWVPDPSDPKGLYKLVLNDIVVSMFESHDEFVAFFRKG